MIFFKKKINLNKFLSRIQREKTKIRRYALKTASERHYSSLADIRVNDGLQVLTKIRSPDDWWKKEVESKKMMDSDKIPRQFLTHAL